MQEFKENQNTRGDPEKQSTSLLDKWLVSIKNHPVFAAFLLVCMVIVGVGSVTGALKQVISFFTPSGYVEPIIQPLKQPVIDRTPAQAPGGSLLTVKRLLEGKSDNEANRIFEIVISNSSRNQVILNDFIVKWQYYKGTLRSIAYGAPLKPVAQYLIKLPIDTDNGEWNSKTESIYPPIVLPPRNESGPSLTTFQFQLHYYFSGRLQYHPSYNWNIMYDLALRIDRSSELSVFSQARWRN